MKKATRDEPPQEINGKGIPIIGKNPIVIKIFIKNWNNINPLKRYIK